MKDIVIPVTGISTKRLEENKEVVNKAITDMQNKNSILKVLIYGKS